MAGSHLPDRPDVFVLRWFKPAKLSFLTALIPTAAPLLDQLTRMGAHACLGEHPRCSREDGELGRTVPGTDRSVLRV